MSRTILLTGATDGIGKVTAHKLASMGHTLLLHGRSEDKLLSLAASLSSLAGAGSIETHVADLSSFEAVAALAEAVTEKHSHLDVLINNAGVLSTDTPRTTDGLDVRFVVNTLSPYLLTHRLMHRMTASSRIINLSSAAQFPVDLSALSGQTEIHDDFAAYAMSKLAITMWSCGTTLPDEHPVMVAVNPGSLLASKMVKQGFGVEGRELDIGADIIVRAALSDEFADKGRCYFDNDSGRFAAPHADAQDEGKCAAVIAAIETVLSQHGQPVN